MWSKLNVVWYGIQGKFKGYLPVENRFWLYLFGVFASFLVLLINGAISFKFYQISVLEQAVGLEPLPAQIGAAFLTFILAAAAWFLLGFLAWLLYCKLNSNKVGLLGISANYVLFALLGLVALVGLDIYANLKGVEDIVEEATVVHTDDPTAGVVSTYQSRLDKVSAKYEQKRKLYAQELQTINSWTGKNHSCTKTGCFTKRVRGGAVQGSHWKGTLTALGSQRLEELKGQLFKLDDQEEKELAALDRDKSNVLNASMGAFNKDVKRYETQIRERNRTLKGYVFIAYIFSFIVEFLICSITFLATEYLYGIGVMDRPEIVVDQKGLYQSSSGIKVVTPSPTPGRANRRTCQNPKCNNGNPVDISHMRSNAKYCSDACRIQGNELKKGYNVNSIKQKRKREYA